MNTFRRLARAVFYGPRFPHDQFRAGGNNRPRELPFMTIANGVRPVH
ncbi:MAG TPA: hypothetical protein VG317_17835 [Pseudonocardiaceae bacterium]|jgi:hypothetical protein|nr:hypothetical protein [Pseudonocardiaceae bacterium]